MTDSLNAVVTEEVLQEQFGEVLAFDAELVAASPKALMNKLSATSSGIVMVLIEDLQVLPDFNTRIKDASHAAHVRTLADSMKEHGFYLDKPLAAVGAMDGKRTVLYITDGHCRYEALLLAINEGALIETVPVAIKDKSTSMEDLTVALVRTAGGKALRPLEIAIACKRLVNFGWKPDRIAQALGFSEKYVGDLLSLIGAPSALREMIQEGVLPAQVALDAMRKHGGDAVTVLVAAAEKAKSQGSKKITKAGLEGRALPKKIVTDMVVAVAKLSETLDEQTQGQLAAYRELDDESKVGVKVEIDAGLLVALLELQKSAEAFKTGQTDKASKKVAAVAKKEKSEK